MYLRLVWRVLLACSMSEKGWPGRGWSGRLPSVRELYAEVVDKLKVCSYNPNCCEKQDEDMSQLSRTVMGV